MKNTYIFYTLCNRIFVYITIKKKNTVTYISFNINDLSGYTYV